MVISRVIIRVTPFRARITLLITYLLSPLPLQVGFRDAAVGFREIRINPTCRDFRGSESGCRNCFARDSDFPIYRDL